MLDVVTVDNMNMISMCSPFDARNRQPGLNPGWSDLVPFIVGLYTFDPTAAVERISDETAQRELRTVFRSVIRYLR